MIKEIIINNRCRDLLYSDSYKYGLKPLINQMKVEIGSNISDLVMSNMSSDMIARAAAQLAILDALECKLKARANNIDDKQLVCIEFFTEACRSLNDKLVFIKNTFDVLCRKKNNS